LSRQDHSPNETFEYYEVQRSIFDLCRTSLQSIKVNTTTSSSPTSDGSAYYNWLKTHVLYWYVNSIATNTYTLHRYQQNALTKTIPTVILRFLVQPYVFAMQTMQTHVSLIHTVTQYV